MVQCAWNPHQHVAGFPIGVLCIDTHHTLLRGNMQHARSYSFAPLFGVVRDVDPVRLFSGDPELAERVLEKASELVSQGVRAIVGACGSFAHYQSYICNALQVPVCLSVLVQIPFLLASMPANLKLLVYFASARSISDALLVQCGITKALRERLVIAEAWFLPAFRTMLDRDGIFDPLALRDQLNRHIGGIIEEQPDIGGIVLQCSDLPPFAADLQRVTGRPIYDGLLLAEWMYATVSRHSYP